MDLNSITLIIAALLAVSEALALIPAVQGNSVFQVIYFFLKAVVNRFKR